MFGIIPTVFLLYILFVWQNEDDWADLLGWVWRRKWYLYGGGVAAYVVGCYLMGVKP